MQQSEDTQSLVVASGGSTSIQVIPGSADHQKRNTLQTTKSGVLAAFVT